MNINFKKYFTFRKKDRLGLILLMTLVLILFIGNLLLPKLIKNEHNFDNSEFSAEVDSFLVSLTPIEENEYVSKLDSFIIARYDSLNLFKFNPNTTTNEQWLLLGLTQKQINTINNYTSKGGKFYDKEDFRKIYGIRTKQFQILKPYIDLPDKSSPNTYQKNNYNNNYQKDEPKKRDITLFEFDPNTATDEDFAKLGLSDKQIKSLNNYRNKGGKYYKKEDFKKMYVISDETYLMYEPYIVINQEENNKYESDYEQKVIPIIDINTADTALFKKLPGIGPVFSERIVKYRTKLGGFSTIDQINEVYGIKPETFTKIEQYLTISSVNIVQININFAEFGDLVKHPYIDKNIANSILKYRKKNGFYTSVNQLLKNNILEEGVFHKIEKYLTVD